MNFDNESSVVTRVLLERLGETIVSLDYVILGVLSPRLYRHSSIFPSRIMINGLSSCKELLCSALAARSEGLIVLICEAPLRSKKIPNSKLVLN